MHRVLLVGALLALTACDDPSPVGVGLVDQQSGDPFLIEVSTSAISGSPVAEVTGSSVAFVNSQRVTIGAGRALFGIASDPSHGARAASAYLDFDPTAISTTAFDEGTVTNAAIVLSTDYVMGDSTVDLQIQVRSIEAGWTGAGARADTTLQLGDLVTESILRYTAGEMEIPLPGDWIAEWDTTLRGSTFGTAFHGFEISAVSGNAIVGLDILSSSLRAVSGGDSLSFGSSNGLTRFPAASVPNSTVDVYTLQDGQGEAARFEFDLAGRDTDNLFLNRGVVSLDADTTVAFGAGFHRPIIEALQLDWVTTDGSRTAIGLAGRTETGFQFESPQLRDSLSALMQGESSLDRLEVRVPEVENGVSMIGISRGTGSAPRLLLAVTPVQ